MEAKPDTPKCHTIPSKPLFAETNHNEPTENSLYIGEPRYDTVTTRKYLTVKGRRVEVTVSSACEVVTRSFRNARVAKKFAKARLAQVKWTRYSNVVLKTSPVPPVECSDGFVDVTVDFNYSSKCRVAYPTYEPNSLVIENA